MREARDCFSLFYALKHTIFALNYTQYSCENIHTVVLIWVYVILKR